MSQIEQQILEEIIKRPDAFLDENTKDFLSETVRRSGKEDLHEGLEHLAEHLSQGLGLTGCGFHINGHAGITLEYDPVTGSSAEQNKHIEEVDTPTLFNIDGANQLVCPLYYKDKPTFGYAFFEKPEMGTQDIATIVSGIKRYSSTLNLSLESLRWKQLALHDGMTGACRREMLELTAKDLVENSRKKDKPLSVVMCDVSQFKPINDLYGHAFGDHVLRTVAKKIQTELRPGDMVIRWGGDEFLVLLAETELSDAKEVARRIEEVIEATDFTKGSNLPPEKASMGYYAGRTAKDVVLNTGVDSTAVNEGTGQAIDILEAICEGADQSMYKHKRAANITSLFLPHTTTQMAYEGLIWRWNRNGSTLGLMTYDSTNFKQAIDALGERNAWRLFIDITNQAHSLLANSDWLARHRNSDLIYAAVCSDERLPQFQQQMELLGEETLRILNATKSEIVPDYDLQFAVGIMLYNKSHIKRPARKALMNNLANFREHAVRLAKKAAKDEDLLKIEIYS